MVELLSILARRPEVSPPVAALALTIMCSSSVPCDPLFATDPWASKVPVPLVTKPQDAPWDRLGQGTDRARRVRRQAVFIEHQQLGPAPRFTQQHDEEVLAVSWRT
mmetsp:Transcript_111839/g.355663  ORF Transcript_111839/g.355663 Transcript_111839/m.355663 type:complete len:106 (+) Transcript_111839:338-655(+)